MTTTYKRAVYKTENDKGILELNAEDKPTKPEPKENEDREMLWSDFNQALIRWNANTIKAEVSGELNQWLYDNFIFQYIGNKYKLPFVSKDNILLWIEKDSGIDILSLMDRIEVNNDSCENCGRTGVCPGECKFSYTATLKPVDNCDEWGIKTYPKKPVVEKGESGKDFLESILKPHIKDIKTGFGSFEMIDKKKVIEKILPVVLEKQAISIFNFLIKEGIRPNGFLGLSHPQDANSIGTSPENIYSYFLSKNISYGIISKDSTKDQRIAELEKEVLDLTEALNASKVDASQYFEMAEKVTNLEKENRELLAHFQDIINQYDVWEELTNQESKLYSYILKILKTRREHVDIKNLPENHKLTL